MSTQPIHRHEPDRPRVERTIGGISDALRASRRAQFFAELLQAKQGQELDDVLNAWWGRAMLDTDPDRDRIQPPQWPAPFPPQPWTRFCVADRSGKSATPGER